LTLVRAALEALTNARKHAAGAAVTVELLFGPGEVQVTVVNATTGPSAIAHTGSGYGLQGMRERLELVGGSLDAGPDGAAWRLRAVVPA
jgi:signal transduction histidine kinase